MDPPTEATFISGLELENRLPDPSVAGNGRRGQGTGMAFQQGWGNAA